MSVFLQLVLVQLALWGSFHPLLGMSNTAEQDTASLTDTDEGPYGKTVKEIRISRLRYTDRDTIIRELASRVGEPYLKENAEKDAKRLDQLGICSSIRIEPIENGEEVVLEIEIEETFPHLPIISLEVNDENGLSIGPGFKSINLSGRDISFSANARFGGATNLSTTLENPWFAGNHRSYRLEFHQRDRTNELDNFAEVSTEIDLRLGSYVGEHGRIGGHFNFLSVGSDTPGTTLSTNNRDNTPSLAFFIGYDSRDFWTSPKRGWWNEVEVSQNGGFLAGDGDFWRVHFDVRRFQPLADRHTLAFFSLTTLQTGTVGVEIPIYQDFHLGGTNSIRGWSLGSTSGKNQFINTLEYRYDLMTPRAWSVLGVSFYLGLQAVLFGDLGTAWGDNQGNQWLDSYGFGIRLLIPFVDMIRIDFAFGEPGKGLNSQIGIGEKAVKQRRRVR
jgi:outer membrane protein insertion porin family